VPPYLKWLSNLSWFKYGNEALLVNQWSGVQSIACDNVDNATCARDGHVVLQTLNFYEVSNLHKPRVIRSYYVMRITRKETAIKLN
jgi:hypothetical protein